MASRFVYVYFMKRAPDRIREIVPQHVRYWKELRLDGYAGGPFADRSGGLILFESADLASAGSLVAHDPFGVHELIEMKWVKEWVPE